MSPLNSRSARVIDPVLSGITQGYILAQRVSHVIFPAIEVMQRGGKVIEFGRESFFDYKARRAPGAMAINIQFGYEGKPYSLDQYYWTCRCRANMPKRRRRYRRSIWANGRC